MSLNQRKFINPKSLAGASRVHGAQTQDLAGLLRDIRIQQAKEVVEAASISAITDSSAGTAGIAVTGDATGGAFENIMTFATPHGLKTGDGPFRFSGTLGTGLTTSTDYYAIVKSTTVIQLATSKANALSGTVQAFSTDGSSIRALIVGVQPTVTSNNLTGLTTGVLATGAGSIDTSADTLMDAYATLAGQANLVFAQLTGDAMDVGPGTDGSGTIAAVDANVAVNTNNTDALSFDSYGDIATDLADAERTVAEAIKRLQQAVGIAPGVQVFIPDGHQGKVEQGFDVNQGAAIANGSGSASTITTSVLETEVETVLTQHANNVAHLADMLDDVTGIAGTAGNLGWIATDFPVG